jgi:energy-coupling factor transport system permease protein
LTTGLERAVQLAESMEARGFGSGGGNHSRGKRSMWRILIAAGLFGLLCAAFWRGYRPQSLWFSVLLALGSMAVLVGTIAAMGRGTRRSRYRRELWRRRDTLVSTAALASILVVSAFWLMDADTLFFYPYPRVSFPGFNPLVGLALLAIVAPVLTAPQMRKSARD